MSSAIFSSSSTISMRCLLAAMFPLRYLSFATVTPASPSPWGAMEKLSTTGDLRNRSCIAFLSAPVPLPCIILTDWSPAMHASSRYLSTFTTASSTVSPMTFISIWMPDDFAYPVATRLLLPDFVFSDGFDSLAGVKSDVFTFDDITPFCMVTLPFLSGRLVTVASMPRDSTCTLMPVFIWERSGRSTGADDSSAASFCGNSSLLLHRLLLLPLKSIHAGQSVFFPSWQASSVCPVL